MAESECGLESGINVIAEMLQTEILLICKHKKIKRKRKIWVRKWIARRPQMGLSANFLNEVETEDIATFTNHLRISPAKFRELLSLVTPLISKKDTYMHEALSAELKLKMVLRYLATGDSFSSLEHAYRVPKSTMSKFLIPVLKAIFITLEDYIKVPSAEEDWKQISNGFASRWNFPGCCGAIDGKHVRMKCPPCSGSDFYNYKGFFSINLFALVDSHYNFRYIQVGTNGRVNDASIFANSNLKEAIEDGAMNFPKWGVIVGDDAFPLTTYLMKPYSHRGSLSNDEIIFNYRLSRARRIVENAFGILCSRFRIFLSIIELLPEKVDEIVKVCCALHNWLRTTSPLSYMAPGSVDQEDLDSGIITPGNWRDHYQTIPFERSFGSNNYSRQAAERREKYKNYFMSDGAVEWQWRKIQ